MLEYKHKPVSTYFGELVFSIDKMKKYLPKIVFDNLKKSINNNIPLDKKDASIIAHAIKEWAVSMGATHYAHWFQPYTGKTAEKHDSFYSYLLKIENFTAKELIQGEPDASSFPSGGTRSTFEARGYTVWDPASPAFLLEGLYNRTLAIPSVFYSYNGKPLDYKTPLLKSINSLEKKCEKLIEIYNINKRVKIFVGAEQEFFLLDRKKLESRYDILFTGRTLIGADSPCEQIPGAHYFGSINPKVLNFLQELQIRLYRLGIPIKTRHNEVAPNQFEIAPFYEEANLSADHNQLLMEITRQVASKYGFSAVFYEKPFKGINGSGKHINWSIGSEDGINFLQPGKGEDLDLIFLLLISAILKGIHDYGYLLSISISSEANELRLGGSEAPPSVISVFLGEQISEFIKGLINGKENIKKFNKEIVFSNLHLPEISKDTSDRNRTAPFAFTGNKFEFRSPGASQSISPPLIMLNSIVSYGIDCILKDIMKIKKNRKNIWKIIKKYLTENKNSWFEGNAYSKKWKKEAKKRKLEDLSKSINAFKLLDINKTIKLMEYLKVYSKEELTAQRNVFIEEYYSKVLSQAKFLIDMVDTGVYPSILKQLKLEKEIFNDINISIKYNELNQLLKQLIEKENKLKEIVLKISKSKDIEIKAEICCDDLRPRSVELRKVVDQIEVLIDSTIWPFPRYRDLFLSHI